MIILTRNFFNVARTAIEKCEWKGSEAKNVHLALQELEQLQQDNVAQQHELSTEHEHDPEAGDIEYHEEEKNEPVIEIEDEI